MSYGDVNASCEDYKCAGGLTRSREAKRRPRRCRVPSTRRTRRRPERNPRSRSHIPPGPAATEAVLSSAPGGELGQTLGGGEKSELDQGLTDSYLTLERSFPSKPGQEDKLLTKRRTAFLSDVRRSLCEKYTSEKLTVSADFLTPESL
ncbi:hypothetical protein XENOCAPTIV_020236 [Xenoophorus captivus]|uniref:Uncharacterized protein n=1 Tax=Xenoophorus captivus TaxID=1517983 RepID=A0ABV0QBU5_9TELE